MLRIKVTGVKNTSRFIKETITELTNISWPNRREVFLYLVAVLLVSAIITAYVYGLDKLFIALQVQFLTIR